MALPTRIDDWFRPLALRSRLDDLWQEAMGTSLAERLPEVFTRGVFPPLNVAETDKSVVVSLEAPGMTEEDIDIEVMGNQITISGEKKLESKTDGKELRRIERQYGKFSRTVTLPSAVRADGIEAVYSKGVLTVTIPKAQETPTKKIKVRASK
jgi:HSP20 family protein